MTTCLCTKTKAPSRAMPTVAPTKIKRSLRSCSRNSATKLLHPASTLQLNLTSTCEPACFRRKIASRRILYKLPAFQRLESTLCTLHWPWNHRGWICHTEHSSNGLVDVFLVTFLLLCSSQKPGGLFYTNQKKTLPLLALGNMFHKCHAWAFPILVCSSTADLSGTSTVNFKIKL